MSSNIREKGAQLASMGYPVVAIAPGEKRPIGGSWQNKPLSEEQCRNYPTAEAGVGILCGYGEKPLIGIDADIDGDNELAQKVFDLWSETCAELYVNPLRIGKPPKFLIVARTAKPLHKITSAWFEKDGRRIRVEVLGKGQQFVAYHTHPETGKPYDWSQAPISADLASTPYDELRFVSPDQLRMLLDAFEKACLETGYTKFGTTSFGEQERRFEDVAFDLPPLGLTPGKATELLDDACLDTADYDTWLHVGMALHHEFHGSRDGRDVWDEWSQKADNYQGTAEIEAKWESFGHYSGAKLTMRWVQAKWRESIAGRSKEFSEQGLVFRFLSYYGSNLRWLDDEKTWLWYTGASWADYPEGFVRTKVGGLVSERLPKEVQAIPASEEENKAAALKFLKKCSNSYTRTLTNVFNGIRYHPGLVATAKDFDHHRWQFGVGNGVVDLRTGEFVPPCPEQMVRQGSSVRYNTEAKCPRWERALLDMMDGSSAMVEYLQRLVGCAMLCGGRESVMVFLVGGGCNGKSVFLETLRKVFGRYARTVSSKLLVSRGPRSESGAETASPVLRSLKGGRFAYCSETPLGAKLEENTVKQLASQDTITARALYARTLDEFEPTWLFFMATNHMPVIRGTDRGIWRRIRVVRFDVDFEKDPRYKLDPRLADELEQELEGILQWCIRGAVDYHKNGLQTPACVNDAVERVRKDFDLLNDWLMDSCVCEPNARISLKDAWRSWQVYARNSGDIRLIETQRSFSRILAERYTAKLLHGCRIFIGLRLKTAEELDIENDEPTQLTMEQIDDLI
jgi:P4 family phage/plasmid primase-like protien|nr:MAG TPA_asm: dsDNA helicase [Caudoviricetes sp.]